MAEQAAFVDAERAAGAAKTSPWAERGEFNQAAHGLRGIAAMMVFAGHLLGGTAKHIYNDDPAYVQAVTAPWHLGTAGVVLFFVISGFVILPSVMRYRPADFALRRFVRLYPLFLALTLLFIALNLFTQAYPKLNDPLAIVAGLTFTNLFVGTEQLTPNAWSLTFEAIFYALICLVVYSTVHRPNRLALIVASVVSLAFVALFPIALFFVGGVIIRLVYDRGFSLPRWPSRVLELAALGCFVHFASISWFAYVPADFNNPVALAILISSLCYFALAVLPGSLTAKMLGSGPALYLGTVSYSLYLVHPYTYYATREIFDRSGLFTDNHVTSMALFYLATTPLTLLATHIVHKTIEMKPYQWVFRQGIYRERGASRVARHAPMGVTAGTGIARDATGSTADRPGTIVRLQACEIVPDRLGREFRNGAAAVVIEGKPEVRSLWNALMRDPDRLPWSTSLEELSANLQAHDDLTQSLGDMFYFKPFRFSCIARKIEISCPADSDLEVSPSRFQYRGQDDQPASDVMAACWRFSRDILMAMGPCASSAANPAVGFRAVVQQLKYQHSEAAHQALYRMMRNALGPWARIGYDLDQRREQIPAPFSRRGVCDMFALLSLIPVVGSPLIRALIKVLSPWDKHTVLPAQHDLVVHPHFDSRYFSALCGTRENIVTQIFAGGRWLTLPISTDTVVILPGLRAQSAFGIKPTLHRVLQSRRTFVSDGDRRMHNVTLLFGAK